MAACGSLQHIFETPLPENPTDLLQSESPSNLLQSLTPWKHLQPLEVSSLTDVFGQLHFKENTEHVSPSLPHSPPSSIDSNSHSEEKNERNYTPTTQNKHIQNSDSFSSVDSESLSICTEGLGFESCDNMEYFVNSGRKLRKARSSIKRHFSNEYLSGKRSRITGEEFPPPISCIGRTGKPWVCFKSYRQNGRFILQEEKIPIQEFLHACRQDGRLKLQYIQSDGEISEEAEEKASEGDCEDKKCSNP